MYPHLLRLRAWLFAEIAPGRKLFEVCCPQGLKLTGILLRQSMSSVRESGLVGLIDWKLVLSILLYGPGGFPLVPVSWTEAGTYDC